MAVVRLTLLLAMLLITGCSSEPRQPTIVTTTHGKPALWKVTAKGSQTGTAWLFGTIHTLPANTDWQGPATDSAIRASSSLVIEVMGLDDKSTVNNLFADMGVSHNLPKLADRVPLSERPKLEAAVNATSVPENILDNMETWAAALTLSSSLSANLGLSPAAGVEHVLQLRYANDQKPVQGLETAERQLGYFDLLPETEQRAMLSAVIEDSGNSQITFQKMLNSWMVGDIDDLLKTSGRGLLASPVLRKILLTDRNQKWASRIAKMIDRGERPFVAVGAGHMAGHQGVPALLAAKGYLVKRIQ